MKDIALGIIILLLCILAMLLVISVPLVMVNKLHKSYCLKVVSAMKQYNEAVNKLIEYSKKNFDSKKLEDSEKLVGIIASDVACLTLSNKRAYIEGNYLGNSNYNKSDIINLETINNIQTKKMYRDSVKRQLIIITIILLFVMCLLTFLGHGYYVEDQVLCIMGTIFVIFPICGIIILCEITKINRSRYMILYFEADNKQYGLEIKDSRIIEQMRNLVLVTKSRIQKEQTVQMPTQQSVPVTSSDKVSKLTELSHLYEQGLLQQDEFERLKSEIISK